MLIKYVRDYLRRPVATIVAISGNNIGVAICNSIDNFDKQLGKEIACGRAEYGVEPKIPNRLIMIDRLRLSDWDEEVYDTLHNVLYMEYFAMKDRAKRYFKDFRYPVNNVDH